MPNISNIPVYKRDVDNTIPPEGGLQGGALEFNPLTLSNKPRVASTSIRVDVYQF